MTANFSNLVLFTLILAFASASFKGFLAVIDRTLFGLHGAGVLLTNLLNNFLALLIMMIFSFLCFGPEAYFEHLLTINSFVFALLSQLVAYAFSYAYKRMKVSLVIISSKSADLFTPFAIFYLAGIWNTTDTLFSLATFLVCLPILFAYNGKKEFSLLASFLVVLSLTAQGGSSPLLVNTSNLGWKGAVLFTAAIVFWRFVWSLITTFAGRVQNTKVIWKREVVQLIVIRSFMTLGGQLCLIGSVSLGHPGLAWPILNCVGIIAVIISSLTIKELPGKPELIAIIFITALSILRCFFN